MIRIEVEERADEESIAREGGERQSDEEAGWLAAQAR
jgi:hypothetical protein